MAKSGDVLEHPVTRERLVWRKVAANTAGELLEADLYVAPGGFVAAEHVHPKQEERFEVLAGVLRLRFDGQEKILRTGEVAVIPSGRPHVWWNGGQENLHVLVELRPALRTEMFFETYFGLARDGKTNRKGLPNPLRLAVLMDAYQDELRLAKPPVAIQKALFGPLAMLGRLLGYRAWYARYSAEPLGSPARSDERRPTSA
jgi:quercetin dioxygenase-like cupin family protein